MYGHLQALELGFFDRQQTGQLMSRATVDLSAVRFFLGYGLIFMHAVGADDRARRRRRCSSVDSALAAVSLLPVPFVVFVAQRYGRRARPALQEVQQRIAELTAEVEENVWRRARRQVLRARGAPARALPRARRARVRPGDGHHAPAGASTTRSSASCPQLGLAAILFFGGRQVIDGRLTVGEFTAFYTYLLMLLSPMRTLGISLGMAQRATASGARALPDPRPRAADRLARRAPRRCRPAPATSSCAT